MKTRYILLLLSYLLTGCSNWLKEEPVDRFVEDNFFEDKVALESALLGGYGRFSTMYVDRWLSWLGEFGTDEVTTNRLSDKEGCHRYLFTSSSNFIKNWYKYHYEVISRFNTVLENVDMIPDMTVEEKEEVKGECYFMRALCYFRLVQTLGPIPLVLNEFKEMDNGLSRASIGDVYTAIITDLKVALEEGRLPERRTSEYTRVNRLACQALLGKVYLTLAGHMQNGKVDALLSTIGKENLGYQSYTKHTSEQLYQLTVEILEPLLGTVDMSKSYKDIFLSLTFDKNTNPEFLWQVQFNSNKSGSDWAKAGGGKVTPANLWNQLAGAGQTVILYVPDMYYNYNAGDVRRDWNCSYCWCNKNANTWGYPDPRKAYDNYAQTSYCGILKFREKEEVYAESIFEDNSQRPTNYPILRYSDVVLMCAEAELMLNGLVGEKSFTEIQKIETRAREGMTSAERIAYLKVKSVEVANLFKELSIKYDDATEYYNSIKGNEEISQSIKEQALAEMEYYKQEVAHIKMESTHASNDVLLWENGLPELPNVGNQQATQPQPFLEYERETFNLDMLKKERMYELAFEGYRRYDLLRWGELIENYRSVYTTTANDNGMGHISENNILLPLPLAQIDLSTNRDGFFQNPGY